MIPFSQDVLSIFSRKEPVITDTRLFLPMDFIKALPPSDFNPRAFVIDFSPAKR